MLKICLVFLKSEPQYAYKRYAYKKKHVFKEGNYFKRCVNDHSKTIDLYLVQMFR